MSRQDKRVHGLRALYHLYTCPLTFPIDDPSVPQSWLIKGLCEPVSYNTLVPLCSTKQKVYTDHTDGYYIKSRPSELKCYLDYPHHQVDSYYLSLYHAYIPNLTCLVQSSQLVAQITLSLSAFVMSTRQKGQVRHAW